ncbi:MAG: hypothetical protein ACO1RX_05815 [Candidatus Sericytochromatia bacterium]
MITSRFCTHLLISSLCLLSLSTLSACGPGGAVTLPGISQNSLDMPVDTVEKWETLSENGDKGEVTTVKTGAREFRFDGRFPSSILGADINVPVGGTISYADDGKAVIRYTKPFPVRVNALYTVTNLGGTITFTATDSEPGLVKAGEKTTLNRKDITRPAR